MGLRGKPIGHAKSLPRWFAWKAAKGPRRFMAEIQALTGLPLEGHEPDAVQIYKVSYHGFSGQWAQTTHMINYESTYQMCAGLALL